MPRRMFLPLLFVGFLVTAHPLKADSTFDDGFERATLRPLIWTVGQQFGTVTPSADLSHSGSQSARFSSSDGGQRNLSLVHQFSKVQNGEVSVWFYDTAPGLQTLNAQLRLYNSTIPEGTPGSFWMIGVQDWIGATYQFVAPESSGDTGIPRSLGWHQFVIDSINMNMLIDGTQIASWSVKGWTGSYGFDSVALDVHGPEWRPNATYYYDDFSFTLMPGPIPEPGTLLLLGSGLLGMAGYGRKKLFRKT